MGSCERRGGGLGVFCELQYEGGGVAIRRDGLGAKYSSMGCYCEKERRWYVSLLRIAAARGADVTKRGDGLGL